MPTNMDRSDQSESPEDIVRRLMEADASFDPLPQSFPHTSAKASRDTGRSKHALSLLGRLTKLPRQKMHDFLARALKAAKAYRPGPRHMALLLMVVILLTMPWLIPVMFLLGLILLLISYLTLGSDRSTELVAAWFDWMTLRNPDGAETLRARAEHVSTKATGLLAYLPERWTAGLYLPDFSHPDESSQTLGEDPFDRLTGDTTDQ